MWPNQAARAMPAAMPKMAFHGVERAGAASSVGAAGAAGESMVVSMVVI